MKNPPPPRPQEPKAGRFTPALSERDQRILDLVIQGRTNAHIAQHLRMSVANVKRAVCSILARTPGTFDRVTLAVWWVRTRQKNEPTGYIGKD